MASQRPETKIALVAFSCKKCGFCPSCWAVRMAENATLLADEVFPEQPVRQWVLSVPYPCQGNGIREGLSLPCIDKVRYELKFS
jgi:hypothetical protein